MSEAKKQIVAVRYIGPDPCPVETGGRRLAHGDRVSGPADVVEDLAKRSDFEAIYAEESAEPETESGAASPKPGSAKKRGG